MKVYVVFRATTIHEDSPRRVHLRTQIDSIYLNKESAQDKVDELKGKGFSSYIEEHKFYE